LLNNLFFLNETLNSILMKTQNKQPWFLIVLSVLFTISFNMSCQNSSIEIKSDPHIATETRLKNLLESPTCLNGYFPGRSGPLSKIQPNGNMIIDSTFTVEKIKISSEGYSICGWLYIPKKTGKFSLVILANGGGGKSLSEWIAPIFAHCGIAAFVHDKRGTGESEGNFGETTYDTYVTDIGNIAKSLSSNMRINPDKIGVMGGSEGGRIAYLAAARFPHIKFAASYAGDITSTFDSRFYAQSGWLKSKNLGDSVLNEILPLWKESLQAWVSDKPEDHKKVNKEIIEFRKRFDTGILPYTKEEMDSIPALIGSLPTWKSMKNDYLSELKKFNKKWLTIFGADDIVVPTDLCVKNITKYMNLSGNKDYEIVVIPKCGHAPVNSETGEMVRIDHIFINWFNENGI
jgi:uncharacterized protein